MAVAYQVVGDGPVDVVYAPHLTNLYSLWLGAPQVAFLSRLSEHVRLIVFNPRGTGLSDRPRNVTLEARMDDINAVLDATGTERAMLFGVAESANVCLLYAATFPERCTRLAVLSVPAGRDERDVPLWQPRERVARLASRDAGALGGARVHA